MEMFGPHLAISGYLLHFGFFVFLFLAFFFGFFWVMKQYNGQLPGGKSEEVGS